MKTLYDIKKYCLTEEFIEQNRLFKVFVLACPRTGSSVMTGCVERLGVKMFYSSDDNEKSKKRDEQYENKFGKEYHPNKKGFFEIGNDDSAFDHYMSIVHTPYSGCKIIIPAREFRWMMLCSLPCKVIQMWRDPMEIKQSQEGFYTRESDDALIRSRLVQQEIDLKKRSIPILRVWYRELCDNPKKELQKVADFIKSPNDIKEAVDFVDPSMTRFKKENLEVMA